MIPRALASGTGIAPPVIEHESQPPLLREAVMDFISVMRPPSRGDTHGSTASSSSPVAVVRTGAVAFLGVSRSKGPG